MTKAINCHSLVFTPARSSQPLRQRLALVWERECTGNGQQEIRGHVNVRTNHRNHSTKKSISKHFLTASGRYPARHEVVGLHRTLEQEIRDFVANPWRSRRTVPGTKSSFQVVPEGNADSTESSALHQTGGIADIHYLQLADQMLRQGKHKKLFSPGPVWRPGPAQRDLLAWQASDHCLYRARVA